MVCYICQQGLERHTMIEVDVDGVLEWVHDDCFAVIEQNLTEEVECQIQIFVTAAKGSE